MFIVKTPQHTIKFTFNHEHFPTPVEIEHRHFVKASTACFLEVDGRQSMGFAACSHLDAFNKERGRKLALARAIARAKLDKADRTAVWDRYHYRDISNAMYEASAALDNLWAAADGGEAQHAD